MFNNNEKYIVRNSKDIFFKFHIENKNQILEEFKDDAIIEKLNLYLSNHINTLNNLINKYEVKLNNIKIERFWDRANYLKNMWHYESKIFFLQEEKEELLQSINRKDRDIEDKDTFIKKINEKFELQMRNTNLFAMLDLLLFKKIALLNHSIDEHLKKVKYQREEKNKIISSLNNLNIKLEKEVEIYKTSIDEYEENLHKLKIEKISENQIYMKDINNYENEIHELNEERENLLRNLNSKIFSLLTLIEKKEIIIQNLRSTRKLVE